jgi:hypothetical protein
MAKYSRFDPKNKKKRNDKYRSEKKKNNKNDSASKNDWNDETERLLKKYNYR